MNDYIKLIFCLLISFISCFILCKLHLKFLASTPKNQIEIIEIKPTHKFKSLGGLDFIIATLLPFILFNFKSFNNRSFITLIFTFLYFAIIGLMDDLIKIICKDNKGLSGFIRIILEVIGSIIILNLLSIKFVEFVNIGNSYLYIGGFVILYILICIVGLSNAINLTDGLDGLVAITFILAITPFVYISIKQNNFIVCSFIVSLIGSLLAYLIYNFNPSKLIMGDVGSLSLGAILAVISFLLNKELLLLISGLIYIVEVLSVILQVSYFKLTHGKRIFKMAPIHYHFIKKGMKESNVVLLFVVIGIVLSILASIIGVRL